MTNAVLDEAEALLAELTAISGPVPDDRLKPYARRVGEICYRAKPTDHPVLEALAKCLRRIGEIGGG
jgi:hypothetical protein